MRLSDIADIAQACRQREGGLGHFQSTPEVCSLRWPDDVVEQWLYDHGDNPRFLDDYGSVNLNDISWDVEAIELDEFLRISTGPSDSDVIEVYASDPEHWINSRRHGIHIGVREMWEAHGTWKRWPLLIAGDLLDPPRAGLQLIEGRTRVGVL